MQKIAALVTRNFKIVFIALASTFLLMSCASDTADNTANQPQQQLSNQQYELVANDKVCMVNDRYMVIKQIPIQVEGITYFGCCKDCVKKLQENIAGVRYASDPVTGEKVDKADAVILQRKADGIVRYFASYDSAKKFLNM
jgi:YHS domain-containing protein